jgi:glycosyltransferase involved in cell wall biosynthesis
MAAPRTSQAPERTASTETGAVVRASRVAIVAPSSASLRRLRSGLIEAMTSRRHGVMCFAPEYDPGDGVALDALGVERRTLAPRQVGFELFAEHRRMAALAGDLSAWRPHAILASGPQEALIAAKAARKAGVSRIVVMVSAVPRGTSGLGSLKATSRALELASAAVFHNADDVKFLKQKGLLPGDLSYVIVPGAGVDLDHHGAQPLPPVTGGLAFLTISRLDVDKGVIDYCEAARILSARAPTAKFRLAGPPGTGRTGLKVASIQAYCDCVEYLGPLDDVRGELGRCHVFVYPSHGEGMPRPVLEAMAAGRPVITTTAPGCRDTVDDRVNGCLVPPSDTEALAAAMESFLKRPDLIPAIARASRAKAERRFDARDVNATLLDLLGV